MFKMWCKIVLFQVLYMISTKFTSDAKNLEIINGIPVSITKVPYMAGFGYDNRMTCGAVIIHKRFVITARHCIRENKTYHVYVGTDIRNDTKNPLEIEQIFRDNSTEVAVLKLKNELEFNDRVKSIKLADPDLEIKDAEMLDVIGFGLIDLDHGTPADKLYQLNVPYFNAKKCKDSVNANSCNDMYDPNKMICAGGEKNKGTCFGDSGGPLRYKDQVVGLAWIVIPCAKGVPDIYARVSTARKFIDDVIKNHSV